MIDKYLNGIVCADSLDIMRELPDECIDLIVTDPPYNIHIAKKSGGFIDREKKQHLYDIKNSFGSDFHPLKYLEGSKRLMKKYNAYWWCSRYLVNVYIKWAKDNNFNFNILIWNKLNPMPLKNNTYLSDTEYCIFMRGGRPYFNNDLSFNNYRKVYNIKCQKNNGHPTPKPIEIIINHIKVSSQESDIILDPFAGSCTTAIAAFETGRKFICIEKEQRYCDIGEKRLKDKKGCYSLLEGINNQLQ